MLVLVLCCSVWCLVMVVVRSVRLLVCLLPLLYFFYSRMKSLLNYMRSLQYLALSMYVWMDVMEKELKSEKLSWLR